MDRRKLAALEQFGISKLGYFWRGLSYVVAGAAVSLLGVLSSGGKLDKDAVKIALAGQAMILLRAFMDKSSSQIKPSQTDVEDSMAKMAAASPDPARLPAMMGMSMSSSGASYPALTVEDQKVLDGHLPMSDLPEDYPGFAPGLTAEHLPADPPIEDPDPEVDPDPDHDGIPNAIKNGTAG